MQATLRLTLIYNCAFNSITALNTECIALMPVTMLLAIFHVIKGRDLFLWSLEIEKCNLTACSALTALTTSYLLLHVILYLHESKMAPIVTLHCLTTKTEHCRGISFFVCHTWNCVAYLILYPPPLAIVHSAHSAVGLNIMRTKPLKQMQSERLAKAKRRSCRRGMSFLRAAPNDWRQLAIT